MTEATATKRKVITLVCERAVDLDDHTGEGGKMTDMPDVSVVKFPCSGMIQPLMIEAALKAGADGVIVCGCQIGDCYYREGNKMIRDRLLGNRPPGLKRSVDRRRVLALWLSRPQAGRFISEAKEFVARVGNLEPLDAAKPAAKPNPKPAASKPEKKADAKPDEKAEKEPERKADAKEEKKD